MEGLQEKINLLKEGALTPEDFLKDILEIFEAENQNKNLNDILEKLLMMLINVIQNKKNPQNSEENNDNEMQVEENSKKTEDNKEEDDKEVVEMMSKKYFLIWENSENPVLKHLNTNELIAKLHKFKKEIPIMIDHIDPVNDVFLQNIIKENGKYYVILRGNKNILEKYNYLSPTIIEYLNKAIISEISLTNNPKLPQPISLNFNSPIFTKLPQEFVDWYVLRGNTNHLKLLETTLKEDLTPPKTSEDINLVKSLFSNILKKAGSEK
jgi:hypothetical protein